MRQMGQTFKTKFPKPKDQMKILASFFFRRTKFLAIDGLATDPRLNMHFSYSFKTYCISWRTWLHASVIFRWYMIYQKEKWEVHKGRDWINASYFDFSCHIAREERIFCSHQGSKTMRWGLPQFEAWYILGAQSQI